MKLGLFTLIINCISSFAGDSFVHIINPGLPLRYRFPYQLSSFWLKDHPFINYKSQSKLPSKPVDVVIIGAGLSALSIAFHLSNSDPKLNIIICEARDIMSGASGRNGGHLTPGYHSSFHELLLKMDVQDAIQLQLNEMLGVQKLLAMVDYIDPLKGREKIELQHGGNYRIFVKGEELSFKQFCHNIRHMINLGLNMSHLNILTREEINRYFGSNSSIIGCIENKASYQLSSGKLGFLIADYLIHKTRVSIFSNTAVETIQNNLVKTSMGNIETTHIIHATNGWSSNLIPSLRSAVVQTRSKPSIIPVRSQILCAKDISNHSFLLGYGFGYDDIYGQRRSKDSILIIGGLRSKIGDKNQFRGVFNDLNIDSKLSAALNAKLDDIIGGNRNHELISEWSGIMGFSSDELPIVGKVSNIEPQKSSLIYKNHWISAGFTGHGMTQVVLCGQFLVHELLTGKILEESLIFNSNRFARRTFHGQKDNIEFYVQQ